MYCILIVFTYIQPIICERHVFQFTEYLYEANLNAAYIANETCKEKNVDRLTRRDRMVVWVFIRILHVLQWKRNR